MRAYLKLITIELRKKLNLCELKVIEREPDNACTLKPASFFIILI